MAKYIIYDNTPWEKQFLFQDLLSVDVIGKRTIISDLPYDDFHAAKLYPSIEKVVGNNLVIFSSNSSDYEMMTKLVSYLKPRIIIHLSDEWGTQPEFQQLSEHTNLLLRQYHHKDYPHYDNIDYIPLGYMDGMFEENYLTLSLKLPEERDLVWSFVGKIRSDRKEMIERMEKLEPNFHGRADKLEMRSLYRNSIFVPSGRGHVVLDCFRLYEASACGAIPIVVGKSDEIQATFKYEENPPWLFFQCWDEAVSKSKELLDEMDTLNEMSLNVSSWWKNRVTILRNKLQSQLNPRHPSIRDEPPRVYR